MNAAGPRFAFADLEAAMQAQGRLPGTIATVLGVQVGTLAAWRKRGLSERQADRLACAAGLHPGEVWSDWFERGMDQVDRLFARIEAELAAAS